MMAVSEFLDFKCVGPDCPETCCAHWNVKIDEESYEKYKKAEGNLDFSITDNIEKCDDYYKFKLDNNGKCKLNEDSGLCKIQAVLGEEYLCNVCAIFPKSSSYHGQKLLINYTMACPVVTEKLFIDQFISFYDDGRDELNESDVSLDEKLNFMIKNTMINILVEEEILAKYKILVLSIFSKSIDKAAVGENKDIEATQDLLDYYNNKINIYNIVLGLNEELNLKYEKDMSISNSVFDILDEVLINTATTSSNPILLNAMKQYREGKDGKISREQEKSEFYDNLIATKDLILKYRDKTFCNILISKLFAKTIPIFGDKYEDTVKYLILELWLMMGFVAILFRADDVTDEDILAVVCVYERLATHNTKIGEIFANFIKDNEISIVNLIYSL